MDLVQADGLDLDQTHLVLLGFVQFLVQEWERRSLGPHRPDMMRSSTCARAKVTEQCKRIRVRLERLTVETPLSPFLTTAPVAIASVASSSGVKKRRALSLEIKECVIRDIESGLKKASVAAKYDVSDMTVSTIYKNKDKLRQQLQQDSSSLSRKRMRTSKYEDVDAVLFRWFHEVRAQNIPVSGPMLQ
ncbi:hypothetical protein HPB51_008937 [Rhipicephalus microplus]|uniref:HTH psq-type domain-containing protein n=1 Tax=Rhipicephalus microplus TaxID=6941 RepID=A0A9J6D593_RHIMP|nr:hypothetical protein HPB51_008937 [Rhipicephalus microplus]